MIDLHSHSDRSDGALSPAALVQRAAQRGLRALALTDHDTVDGLDEAVLEAERHGVQVVAGVEISVTWNGRTLHVVGLGIDPCAPRLVEGLHSVRAGRLERARAIAAKLHAYGVDGTLEPSIALASNPAMVSRTHFARHLVASGVCKDMGTAFRRYLGEGKAAYVRHTWAALAQAVQWIRESGGLAVLAHPGRYGLRRARMHDLFAEFRAAGGAAVEVVSGSHTPEQTAVTGQLAVECGLLASAGSDFHAPEESWLDLGQLAALPSECRPVWQDARLGILH